MKTYVIAEIGCNHLGDMTLAKDIIAGARVAGADAVKLQVYQVDKINDPALHSFLTGCSFSREQHTELWKYSLLLGLDYICSAFDVESVRMLADIGMSIIKIPSGQIHSPSCLIEAFKYDWDVIVSTGMCELAKIKDVIRLAFVENYDLKRLSLLHCVSSYPLAEEHCNLLAIKSLDLCSDVKVGYSDHCMNKLSGACAVAVGAKIIEHHIKGYSKCDTPDNVVSFDPKEFYDYVKNIRTSEKMLGDGDKRVMDCEQKTLFRRDYR